MNGKSEKDKLSSTYRILLGAYGEPQCFLKHQDGFQLLVMAVLSAQCTDAKVNAAAPAIFAKYPDAASLAAAKFAEFSRMIRPLGLYRAKAKNLIATSRILVGDFGGEVPDSMEDLVRLPGIGRKTANVILGHVFGKPGFPVDTHVGRIMRRMGFAREKDSPEKIESFVNANLPEEHWSDFSLLLISHGRAVCKAGRPRCESCIIRGLCRTGSAQISSEATRH